jgi:hypothetical protein
MLGTCKKKRAFKSSGAYVPPRIGTIMRIKVKLDYILTGMEFQTDEMSSYLGELDHAR